MFVSSMLTDKAKDIPKQKTGILSFTGGGDRFITVAACTYTAYAYSVKQVTVQNCMPTQRLKARKNSC